MSHLVSDKVVRLDLGDGEWVDLKAQMSVGDYEAIAIGGTSSTPEGLIVPTLVTNIKAWNMKDEAGQLAELTPENVACLDSPTAVKVFRKIGEMNKKSKKASAKTS